MNLLIVDDHPTDLKLLRAQLEAEGHAVFEAHNGVDALALLERQRVDAVISDILMPRMDGYRLCHEIRKHARLRDLPIIIYSSTYTSLEDEKLALEMGADKYLKKPASVATLVAALHEVVAQPLAAPHPDALREVEVLKNYNERLVSKLKESAAKLQAVFNTVGTGIIIIDRDTQIIIEANQTAMEMTGLPKKRIIGQICHSLVCPAQAGKCPVKDLGQSVDNSERKLIHADGHLKDILKTVYPITIKGKDCYVESFIDITERKRAEKEIQSLARFPSENPNPVLRIARDGTLLYINEAGLNLLPEWHLHVGQAASPMLREAALQAMDCGSPQMVDFEHGQQVYLFSITPIVGAGYANLYARNVTERKQVEEALRESEEKYRILFTSSSDAIMLVEPLSGKFTSGNQTMMKMFGLKNDDDFSSFGPWDFSPEWQPDGRASAENAKEMNEIAMRDGSNFFEWTHKRLNGEEFSANVRLTRMVLDKKTILQATVRDITERKKSEDDLRKSESRLRSLSAEIARVEESERYRLAIYLHDEIGQSLALLRMKLGSFATASKSKSDKHDIKVLRDLLETIIEQTRTLIFELSPPVLHQLGLEAAIEWAGEKISRDHGLDFTFNDDGMAKSLNPDLQAILFRCVRELMLNTVKHAKAKRLTVAIAREGEKILYTIADDGLGFDPSLHDTRTEETGFGLLSVREHLATMGGNCRIQSTPGQGTRITLTVPVGGGAPEERDAAWRMTDGSLIPENEP